MTVEIPFNEEIYRKQIKLTFDLSWQTSRARNKRDLIGGIIAVLLGFLMLYGNANVGIVFVIIGGCVICSFLVKLNRYKDAYNETQKLTNATVEKWKLNPMSYWEFENDFFRFRYYAGEYKIYWEYFQYFNVTDGTLFFGFNKNGNYYALSEIEVGKEIFSKIVTIVKSKIELPNSTNIHNI